jgi:hypothetical protein
MKDEYPHINSRYDAVMKAAAADPTLKYVCRNLWCRCPAAQPLKKAPAVVYQPTFF